MAMACVFPAADPTLAASLLPWDTYTIEATRRSEDLPEPHHNYLRLLAGQMGVGGDDSWGHLSTQTDGLPGQRTLTLNAILVII